MLKDSFQKINKGLNHRGKNEEERSTFDELRGTPLSVGTLEEITDENHTVV